MDSEPVSKYAVLSGDQQAAAAESGRKDAEENCCCSVVHTIWRTRDTQTDTRDEDKIMKTSLQELITYCCFLVVLTIVAFGMSSSSSFYYNSAVQRLFLDAPIHETMRTFRDLRSLADVWLYLRQPLLDSLHEHSRSNGSSSGGSGSGRVDFSSRQIGAVRLRQSLADNSTSGCRVAKEFRSSIDACYGVAGVSEAVVDLPRDEALAREELQRLEASLWIGRSGRRLQVELTLYNADVNLFCVVQLLAELPASGGVLPSWTFRVAKLLRYAETVDFVIAACECLFVVFVAYYFVEEALELRRKRMRYFKNFWNVLDLSVLLISCVCIGLSLRNLFDISRRLPQLLQDEEQYPDFRGIAAWQLQVTHASAVAVFAAWLKLFKYVSFSRTMSQLFTTLGACVTDLAAFCLMFLIIFAAFAQLGFLIFGSDVEDFNEIQQSVFTLFRIILGDFNFHKMEQSQPVIGPIYFILYVFFVFFVLINMFLAIVSEAYCEVKTGHTRDGRKQDMGAFLRRKARALLNRMRPRSQPKLGASIDEAIRSQQRKLAAGTVALDLHCMRRQLKRLGYPDAEVEAAMARFDADCNRQLNFSELRHLREELRVDQEEEWGSNEEDTEQLDREDFYCLWRRVDRLESSVCSAADSVCTLLSTMERLQLLQMEEERGFVQGLAASSL